MKMRKGKKILILLGLCFFNVLTVNASGNASVGFVCNPEMKDGEVVTIVGGDGEVLPKCKIEEDCSIKYGSKCHKKYDIKVTYNGQTLDGYCGDLGESLDRLGHKANEGYTCTDAADDAITYILSSNYSREIKTAALRNYTNNTSVNNAEANKLAAEAKAAGGLKIDKISENENVVTYIINEATVSDSIRVEPGENCESVVYDKGSKTIKVTVKSPSCSYEFKIYGTGASDGSGALKCSKSGFQDVYILAIDDHRGEKPPVNPENEGSAKTIKGSLENTGSSYYKQYCGGDDKNKCSDYTYVNIPTLCDKQDYSETNKVTIDEFPKDVQYCVLNGHDVTPQKNSFEMADNQISHDNPYCKVFCREEYEMNLPGAKFAESGRYFVMDNPVQVKATRSCYATGANGNSEEPQIDIEKFRDNVITKQLEILKAKNDILKAKKELEQANATQEKDVSACGEKVGVYGLVESTSVTGYNTNRNNCNQQTGVCQINRTTISTSSYEWGIKATEKEVPQYDDKGVQLTEKKCVPEITRMTYASKSAVISQINANLQNAIGRLNKAQNDLNDVLKWMQECYNWENNFCLKPTVKFNYEEPYNGQMNHEFEVVSGGDTSSEAPTYSSSKTLPNREYDVTEGENLDLYDYITCGRDDNTDCFLGGESHTDKKISTLAEKMYYRKIVSKGNAEYKTQQEWSTQIPHGTVVPEGKEGEVKRNYYYLGAVFPIALKTPYGVYKWTLDFEGIGQYNTSGCKLGRLDNVLSGDPSKLKVTGRDNASSNGGIGANLQYVCVYVVDCPDCDYECVGEYCEIPDCDDGECAVECVGNYCVYNGNGDTFTYRTVSLNDLNKAERTLGVNLSDKKGTTTVNKIIDTGEKAYENYEATFLMTAENMKSIRDYNKITGNYVSEDLTFEKNNDYINGKSEFLRSESINTSSGRFSWRDFFKSKDIKDVHAYWTDASADLASVTSPNTHVGPAWK